MHWLDWTVFLGFLAWIVYDGLKRTRDSHELEGYFLAKRSIPWWAAGISVMATQLSAITMIGTTGQGYADGMRFIQFYFGLPLAMIVLSVTLVPFFYRSGVYTAYEYLEKRFDAKTRGLTSLLFLVSRGMSCGAIVSAPAVVLSLVLGLDLTTTSLLIALPAIVYTMFGGVQAVTWTDVKIMVLILVGLVAVIVVAILGFPAGVSIADGLGIAAATVTGALSSVLVMRGSDLARLMITMGVAAILYELANKLPFTGGADGLQGVVMGPLLGKFEFDLYGRTAFGYSLVLLIVGLLIARRIVASPFGWSLRAIRDNRLRAAAIGLNVDQRLGVIYTISAAMAGAAGALLAQTTGFASLDVLDFHRSADTMLMLVIGGAGWLWGGVLGALAFKVLHDLLSAWTPQYWTFWLGLFLLALVMVGRDRFFKPWTWFRKGGGR